MWVEFLKFSFIDFKLKFLLQMSNSELLTIKNFLILCNSSLEVSEGFIRTVWLNDIIVVIIVCIRGIVRLKCWTHCHVTILQCDCSPEGTKWSVCERLSTTVCHSKVKQSVIAVVTMSNSHIVIYRVLDSGHSISFMKVTDCWRSRFEVCYKAEFSLDVKALLTWSSIYIYIAVLLYCNTVVQWLWQRLRFRTSWKSMQTTT